MAHKRTSKNSSTGRKSPKSTKTTKPATAGTSKMTLAESLVAPRSPIRERRTDRRIASGKRLAMARAFPGKLRAVSRRSLDPCDNSNDSGLGFDNHVDHHASITERLAWTGERAEAKRPRLDIKLEDDEVNDNFTFPETVRTCKDTMSIIRTAPSSTAPTLNVHGAQSSTGTRAVPRCTPLSSRSSSSQSVTLTSQLTSATRNDEICLRIVSQPEQQHRARYQTEGSRGAVKDRSGNGFPVVQLTGYHKPATLQVFIGTDVGKVTPHMFYQACRVSGKNSTPCVEKKLDGTVVIELQLDPAKDMVGTCDCVGILKERNVDVEHRFPDQIGSRSKKKSTRCRMVFRTTITHDNGAQETLQVCSQPIVCTQPPGIPEICKKSLTSCPATGGLELYILGKNFLKDTKVFFQQADEQGLQWEQFVVPDKEFLQQTHLVCVIPPYVRTDITEPVTVRLLVVSSGKTSEPHQFVYTPTSGAVSSVHVETTQSTPFMNKVLWSAAMNKHEQGIMPPPGTTQMPLSQRRPSVNVTSSEVHSPPLHSLKQELIDENSQSSVIDSLEFNRERFRCVSESSLDVQQGDSNMTMINENTMDILRRNSTSLDAMNQSINENSMSSMGDNGMEMMVRRNSVSQSLHHENSMDVPLVNSGLTLTETSACLAASSNLINHPRTEIPATIVRDELAVMDLRMKMPAATVADLASTNAPSLATLQSFGVTDPTYVPLPAQTAQSIENYLSTIETKPVNVDAMSLSANSAMQLTQILNSTQQSTMLSQPIINNQVIPAQTLLPTTTTMLSQPIINNQVIPAQTLLPTTTTQSLSHLGAIQSHLGVPGTVSNFNTTQPSLLSTAPVGTTTEQALLQHNGLITEASVNAMQSAIDGTILSKPLTPNIMSSPGESNSSRDGHHSPQDMLIGNKSPLIPPAPTQDVLLNAPQQTSLLVSPTINTSLSSSSLEQPEVNSSAQTAPNNISPDIILNSQISPSMMCRNTSALSQEGLLSTMCQPNVTSETNLIQPQMAISENVSQQNPLPTLLTTDTSPRSLTPSRSPVALSNQLSSVMNTTEPEKAILLKAAVDLLETQKKISELETLTATTTANSIEQVIINDMNNILSSTSSHESATQLPNQGNNMHQTNLNATLIASKTLVENSKQDFVVPVTVVKDISNQIQSEKKNEESMIMSSGFATMSEHELINIINPSTFDQV
ncbi:hypothetical protein ILUMI_22230 [Ignelater luminosus]|uniref:Nuclear factor of activated T-cells 5 n=1 Tax=Ignelater luminosus TaxID=2038154 RepID=A0A8K0CG70_IGNLU|nr:hypothetical protein ILUMI_22230 [Ignelater luminosus]